MSKTNRRAATTRLEPGQHSVDRNTAVPTRINGRDCFALYWSVRLWDGRLIENQRTVAKTKTDVRLRARRRAVEMLEIGSDLRSWKLSDPIERFIDEVSVIDVDDAPLRPQSKRRYFALIKLLRTQLQRRTIAEAMQYDVLTGALDDIGHTNGPEAARQAKTVLGHYIAAPLRKRRLLSGQPLADHQLQLSKYSLKIDGPRRGGQGLSAEDHHRVIDFLSRLDPAAGVVAPKRGPYGIDVRITRRKRIIDLTMVQAGAGLRISEALQLTPAHIYIDRHGLMRIVVPKEISKTGVARETPVLIPAVQEWITTMLAEVEDDEVFLFGTPSDRHKRWRADGSTGAGTYARKLYQQIAEELGLPTLQYLRTHLWRTALSSRCAEAGIPRQEYAAFLGHDPETNEKNYTEGVDLNEAANRFRARYAQ